MALAASAPPGPSGGRCHRQLWAAVVVLAACLAACVPAAAAAPKANSIPSTNAISFLRQFGYLEGARPPGWDAVDVGDRFGTTNTTTMGRPDSETLYTEEAVVTAIKLVQKFGAIPQTGVIDEATDKLMKARRCGCPDVVRHAPEARGHTTHRHKRFVVASKGWKRRHLKYYIANWTPKIGEDGVNALMVRAFDAWSAYGRLRFTRAAQPSEADITIAFGRGNHGDWFPFDGPGGILAHAFYPYEMATYGGDIHFDDDEQWAADPNATELYNGAVDLFLVAVHEMGHSLGLGHSPDPESIMFPYYQSKSESFKLGQDDILGMYELYIKRQLEEDNETPTYEENHRPPPPPNTTPRPPRTTTTRTTTTRRPRPPPRPRPTTTTTTTPRPRRPPSPPPSRPPPHRPPPPTSAPTYHGDDETVEEHKKHDHKHGIPPGPAGPVGPSDAGPGGGGGHGGHGGGHSHGHGSGHGSSHGSGHGGSHGGHAGGGSGHGGSGHAGSHGASGNGDSEENNVIPDLCEGHYDAVAQLRGELFAFKGQYLWRFRQRGEVMQGYPVPLRRMFRDLPEQVTKLDAVYQRDDGNIVLFSGPRYWVYNGVNFVENSPQSITRLGLPSSIDRIDAVMIWAKNKATYFFRGSEFWRYNTTTSRMDPGYPKRISNSWKRAPNEIDDAMTWTDGVSHFFKGDLAYQIDNAHVTVARIDRTAQIWFGCR
ncbi:matrix metalloproteinase-17-like isoform X2 [Thrips palmi]|uniref:Matrix metalloproteinase-17-like isoform X2 n=1 Tax=Thrips palmi TaxID=161013 RepID=A0A6P9A465_THRPL|nr:matrix metalloproteinase-17-like isoform X2 [Thrips palmi]